jgi:hypothetical protein
MVLRFVCEDDVTSLCPINGAGLWLSVDQIGAEDKIQYLKDEALKLGCRLAPRWNPSQCRCEVRGLCANVAGNAAPI